MNRLIRFFTRFFIVMILIIGKAVYCNSNAMNKHTNIRNSDFSDFEETNLRRTVKNPEQFQLAYHNEAAEQNMALKRVSQKYNKPFYNRTTDPKFESISTRKKKKSTQFDNSNNKNTHSFEEIHEHIDETYDSGSQYQASEPFESETLPHTNVENKTNKKHRNHVKTKIKHHHHHHHHNHIKELIKTVPQPYSVEKLVHVPIEKVVEKVVHVPKFINVTIEKIVHVPIEKIVEKVIHIPKPYVVEKLVEKIIHVPKPYPVLRTVPYPIEIKVPIQVEKKVPFPYKVEVERKVPVYIQTKEPYTFEKSSTEHYSQFDQPKFNIERGLENHHYNSQFDQPKFNTDRGLGNHHYSSQFDQPKFNIESGLGNHHYNRVYKFKEQKIPNKIEELQYTVETENNKHLENSGSQQYASASENMPWKFVGSNSQLLVNMNNEGQGKPLKFHIESDNMGSKEFAKSALPPKHVHNQIFKIKEINLPYNAANFQKTFQPEYTNFDLTSSAIQRNISASDKIPLTFLNGNVPPDMNKSESDPSGIALPLINNTHFIISPEESTYSYQGIPFSLPANFGYLQPADTQKNLSLDLSMPEKTEESYKI